MFAKRQLKPKIGDAPTDVYVAAVMAGYMRVPFMAFRETPSGQIYCYNKTN